MLLDKKDFEQFYKNIIKDIEELQKNITTIEIKNILDRMGFPKNYKKLLKI